jgi:serine/threonine-protein kinase
MVQALEFAHGKGVIHRDLKPSNIMVSNEGVIKVMDFGIARLVKDAATHSLTNTIIGTPPYMAPEQEQGVVRREGDVYSLAVCVYEMLAGELPFAGSGAGMLMNKMSMSYTPISEVGGSTLKGLDEVFARAFQADPDKRYKTPGEFYAALKTHRTASA